MNRLNHGAIILSLAISLSGSGAAPAAVNLLLSGTPGSSIVNFQISGSGTFTESVAAANVNGLNYGVFNPLDTGLASTFGFASGGATMTFNYPGFSVDRTITGLTLIDSASNSGDEFLGLVFTTTSATEGETYSLSGSGTLDLSSTFVGGSPATFDDLNVGSGSASSITGVPVDGFIVTIQQVPEPSGFLLATLGALALTVRRRR